MVLGTTQTANALERALQLLRARSTNHHEIERLIDLSLGQGNGPRFVYMGLSEGQAAQVVEFARFMDTAVATTFTHPDASIDVVWRLVNAPEIQDQGTLVYNRTGVSTRDLGRAIGMPEAYIANLAAEADARLAAREVRGGAVGDDGGEMENKALFVHRGS